MRISEFIARHSDEIIKEWEAFARGCPPAPQLDWRELRNNIAGLLKFIVEDLETPQSARDQAEKSKGRQARLAGEFTEAESHAEQRFTKGFDTIEMMSEFRALRASITKLWLARVGEISRNELEDLVRFNEAVDQLLTESLESYTDKEHRARSLFLGTLIHDIRNPLNAIVQSSQLLQLFGSPDERKTRLFSQIQRSAARIGDLVSQLIDTVRLRMGKPLPLNRMAMNMADTARQVVEELRAAHPNRKITLEAEEAVPGEWDASRIDQIISNLVGNAVKHGDPAQPITVAVAGTPEEGVISVHNWGPAIASDDIPTIFDPMTRGLGKVQHDPDKMSLGLGLFITRQITLAHGGSISVSSTPEKGTTFVVRLPRLPPEEL